VADALREFEGWHPQVRAIIGATDVTNRWALIDGRFMTAIGYRAAIGYRDGASGG
jgi:hypothetical protein